MFALYLYIQLSFCVNININEEEYVPHDPIRETTINIDVKKCIFNNLVNLTGNGGAILITTKKKVNCTINDCQFNQCKAQNGGAIWAFYSAAVDYEFSIIKSTFTGCESETRGGAVYIQSAQPLHHTFNITECTFNNNKAVYGGGLYAELRDQLTFESCTFNNNEATKKGSSAYLKLGHENIKNHVEEHDTFNIHKNVFKFNPSSSESVNVYIENDKITDTTDPSHANVFFGGCIFSIEEQTSSTTDFLHLEIRENEGGFESFTFDSCTCVHQNKNTVKISSSNIYLFNFNFDCTSIDKCTSDQPSFVPTEPPTQDVDGYTPHQPIQEPTTVIELSKSKFTGLGSLEKNGGAIFISFAKKVNCMIDDCKFDQCKGKNGGAISASYSSTVDYKFKISKSSFSGCQADSKGGAVYVQSAQPLHHIFDIVESTFNNNKAYNGGALYAELRDQLNLENCRFVSNEAANKGSSAYLQLGHENIKNSVEEHDIFNIHGNVFIFSPSSAESVNVYIENDKITDTTDAPHANVFLGGCTFSVANSKIVKSEFLHLEVVENEGGFESFTFDSCNCVQQDESTVRLYSENIFANFTFGCQSIDKCDSNSEEKPSDSSSSLSSSSSSSSNDKDVENSQRNGKNKSKVAMTIGIAVACVVVVIVIVVVVLIVIRKKLSGKYVNDIRTDDIAENLNAEGASSISDINNPNSAL